MAANRTNVSRPTARSPCSVFDLANRHAGVFVVQPDSVEAALHAKDLYDLGIAELPDREDADQLVLCEKFFDALAHTLIMRRASGKDKFALTQSLTRMAASRCY